MAEEFSSSSNPHSALRTPQPQPRCFVCLCEDVTTKDLALVLALGKGGDYDLYLVYFGADNKVNRVLARHTLKDASARQPAQMAQAVMDAWGRAMYDLGWPRRTDFKGERLEGMGWHDERTRVRLFWDEANEGGPRVWTEWRDVGK